MGDFSRLADLLLTNDLDTALRLIDTVSNKDFFYEIARGNVAGQVSSNIVAHSGAIDTTIRTVWEEGVIYTYSSTADIDTLSSDNAGDTHDITIIGLDSNWNQVTQTKTLSGTTPVTLTTSLIRVNTIYNATGTATQGEIYLWVAGGGDTAGVPTVTADIRARITFVGTTSNERSVSSVCSTPVNKTTYIVFGKTSASAAKAIELTFWARQFGGVFQIAHHVDFKDNNYDYFFKIPAKTLQKSDIEVRATGPSSGTEVSASYDIVTVDN